MIEHDTCNPERLQGNNLEPLILDMVKEQGIKDHQLIAKEREVPEK